MVSNICLFNSLASSLSKSNFNIANTSARPWTPIPNGL